MSLIRIYINYWNLFQVIYFPSARLGNFNVIFSQHTEKCWKFISYGRAGRASGHALFSLCVINNHIIIVSNRRCSMCIVYFFCNCGRSLFISEISKLSFIETLRQFLKWVSAIPVFQFFYHVELMLRVQLQEEKKNRSSSFVVCYSHPSPPSYPTQIEDLLWRKVKKNCKIKPKASTLFYFVIYFTLNINVIRWMMKWSVSKKVELNV
jgi:hypothetical protein